MWAEYSRQVSIKLRICDRTIRQFVVEDKFDEIYLGIRGNYDKIYPNKDGTIINSIEGVLATKFIVLDIK